MNIKLYFIALFSVAVSAILLLNSDAVTQIKAEGNTYKWDGTNFQQTDGELNQIAVGADGTVWGVQGLSGIDPARPDDYNGDIYKYDGTNFQQVPGQLKQIAVGNKDNVWGVNSKDWIYKYDGTHFVRVDVGGFLKAVFVGADGTVWGINDN
ncbi:MAG: tectonin domain-containing protein, partial [Candidatus Nitrosocosmicus sp.]